MRSRLTVVWLDDKINKSTGAYLEEYFEVVEHVLQKKGYQLKIIKKDNLGDAIYVLKDKKARTDFFITDLNLEEQESGIDFLKKIREESGYSQHIILYSNTDIKLIKDELKNLIDTENLKIISNFSCVSLAGHSPLNNFEEQINIILEKWKELNALRGRIMCDNAEIEYMLNEIIESDHRTKDFLETNYAKKISVFKNILLSQKTKRENEKLLTQWMKFKEMRDALAHCEEHSSDQDGFFIQSSTNEGDVLEIYEKEIFQIRKDNMQIKNNVMDFLQKYKDGKLSY